MLYREAAIVRDGLRVAKQDGLKLIHPEVLVKVLHRIIFTLWAVQNIIEDI